VILALEEFEESEEFVAVTKSTAESEKSEGLASRPGS